MNDESDSLSDVWYKISEVLFKKNNNLKFDMWNETEIIFKGIKTKIWIMYNTEENIIIIKLTNNINSTECLNLEITENNSKIIGYISYVRTPYGTLSCTVPKDRVGSWLIKLSQSMLCSIGVSYLHLIDAATVLCKETDINYSLSMYRIYHHKKTFYESFGFKSSNKDYDNLVKKFRNINSIVLMDFKYINLNEIKKFYQLNKENTKFDIDLYFKLDNIDIIIKSYDKVINILSDLKTQPNINKSLCNYMSSLYNIDCKKYALLDEFINSVSLIFETGSTSWLYVYKQLKFSFSLMEDNMTC